MNKEQQDLSWACLPKEAREEVIRCFKYASKNSKSDLQRGSADTLEHFFGSHNLTSDTEPEEMLMVERTSIINRYKGILAQQDSKNFGYSAYNQGQKDLLDKLFGDKCLPDKEESVQAEPRFKVGDKVRVLENAILVDNRGKIATIVKQGQCCKGYGWVLDISKSVFLETELEPYTEPETKDNMEEKELNRKAFYDALCELETASIKVRKALISM